MILISVNIIYIIIEYKIFAVVNKA